MPLPRRFRRKLQLREQLRALQSRSRIAKPEGTIGPPDFVGIGVQRCGTTWWHEMIESHPSITPLGFGAKELHFFDKRWSDTFDQRDIDRYHAQFVHGPGQLAGEWTPRYLFDPWVLPLLRRAAPEARLLVLLREPVARFRSGLNHARVTRKPLTKDTVNVAFQRGLYAEQLESLLATVPREQVLVLQLERCIREPRRMLERTFEFLGLPAEDVPVVPARNSAGASVELNDLFVPALRERYRADAERVARLVPDDIDLDLWRNAER